jgi:hypothetical protein
MKLGSKLDLDLWLGIFKNLLFKELFPLILFSFLGLFVVEGNRQGEPLNVELFRFSQDASML